MQNQTDYVSRDGNFSTSKTVLPCPSHVTYAWQSIQWASSATTDTYVSRTQKFNSHEKSRDRCSDELRTQRNWHDDVRFHCPVIPIVNHKNTKITKPRSQRTSVMSCDKECESRSSLVASESSFERFNPFTSN